MAHHILFAFSVFRVPFVWRYSIIACQIAFSKSRWSDGLLPCIMIMETIFSLGSMC
jgi:hypothetical protein